MRIWALMCFAGMQGEEKNLWPIFLYPWGGVQICRWCRCWNACPPHKHWKGQWGNCSALCIRWAATSFAVIAPDSCWKVLFGLNQHMSCAPHGQLSHLGCTDEQHTGACSGRWKSWGKTTCVWVCLYWILSAPWVLQGLYDLAVSKPNGMPLRILCVPGCDVAWDMALGAGAFLLLWRKDEWWMAQVLFLPCLPNKPPLLVLFWYHPLLKENFITKSFSVLITAVIIASIYSSYPATFCFLRCSANADQEGFPGAFSKDLQFSKFLRLLDLDCWVPVLFPNFVYSPGLCPDVQVKQTGNIRYRRQRDKQKEKKITRNLVKLAPQLQDASKLFGAIGGSGTIPACSAGQVLSSMLLALVIWYK